MKMGIMGDLNVTVTDIRDPAGLFCRGQMIRKKLEVDVRLQLWVAILSLPCFTSIVQIRFKRIII